MRANTQKIYDRLIRGAFITEDSSDPETKRLYCDIEENEDDYGDYFLELGLRLESGDGYYYFSRDRESRQSLEQKLLTFSKWIDILDFLKTFDISFSIGMQFRAANILERINLDVELRDKARKLYRKLNTNQDVVDKLMQEMTGMGYAELINEQDSTYKVTAAFRYAEELADLITIYNEEDTPEQ